jgi:hypothetical protein
MQPHAIRRSAVTILSLASLAVHSTAPAGRTQDPVGESASRPSAPRFPDVRSPADSELPVAPVWSRVYVKDASTRFAAQHALREASTRLLDSKCQGVVSEFRDERGRPLTDKLSALGMTAQGFLELVIFQDAGERLGKCDRQGTLAFTTPGDRIVYLCGRAFERAWRRNPDEAQNTMIHEMLHALGLGENPPSPREISYRIRQLCF